MEAVLFQIVRALATVFEITLAFALLNAMFEPKYASKWPLRLSYILLLAAVFSSSARLTVISVKQQWKSCSYFSSPCWFSEAG